MHAASEQEVYRRSCLACPTCSDEGVPESRGEGHQAEDSPVAELLPCWKDSRRSCLGLHASWHIRARRIRFSAKEKEPRKGSVQAAYLLAMQVGRQCYSPLFCSHRPQIPLLGQPSLPPHHGAGGHGELKRQKQASVEIVGGGRNSCGGCALRRRSPTAKVAKKEHRERR